YQFNFEIAFSDDDPNALLPRSVDLGQIPSFPAMQDFSVKIRNSGESNPLTVQSVVVTGGPQAENFSVVDFTAAVDPRGEGAINFQIDSKGQTGLFSATIEVKTDDATPEDQSISFEISASVLNLAGPASRLTLDEAAGSTDLIDITGFNRHGVVKPFDGVASLGEAGLKAQTGTAMRVSGGGGGSIPGSAFDGSLSEFAVSLWVNPSALGSLADQTFGTIVGMGTDSPLFGLLSADGEVLWFGDRDGTADVLFSSTNTPLSVDTVHHVVLMRSDDRASIWIDGEEVAGIDDPDAVPDTSDSTFYIGGFNGALGFSGVIDDVQIYDRALPEEDVKFLSANPGLTLGETGAPADSDGDGLDDQREAELGTDPLVADSDGDGLQDGAEVDTHMTNPLSTDTDNDKFDDALEIAEGYDPLDPENPGGLPSVRAGDPNDPLVTRANVDAWSALMVIDETRPFDFASIGASSGIVQNFQ
ncbi:MAG: LamG-like jellyroll fold domain-containing protein, partial [Verrucomicrobiales bacterium]